MTAQKAEDIRSEGVPPFVEAAKRYCSAIERRESYSEIELLRAMDELLPLLLWSACALPDLESEEHLEFEHKRVKEWIEEHHPIMNQLRDKFGVRDVYHFVFDPASRDDHESIPGTLSDDLASVYMDLKEQFNLYNSDEVSDVREAIWHWRFSFASHWGHHATGALRAVHWLVHQHYDAVDNEWWDTDVEEEPSP